MSTFHSGHPRLMSDSKNVHTLPPMARLYDLMNERGPRHRMKPFPPNPTSQWSSANRFGGSSSYSRIQSFPRVPAPSTSSLKARRVSSFSSISTSGSISRHDGDQPESTPDLIDPVRCLSSKSSSGLSTAVESDCVCEESL